MAVMEAISTQYLEADVATVLFEDIPTTYEHLQLRMNIASDSTSFSGTYRDYCLVYFNTSTATTNSDYAYHLMTVRASSVNAYPGANAHSATIPFCAGTSLGAAHFGTTVADILDYRNGSKNTTIAYLSGAVGPGTGSSEVAVALSSGAWDNVAAVTKILLIPDLGSNWRRGSSFSLYGLKSS